MVLSQLKLVQYILTIYSNTVSYNIKWKPSSIELWGYIKRYILQKMK